MQEYDKYIKFLEELKSIKPVESRESTFLDVAGYPNYENVISNILAFLFDVNTHGFGDLWIKSLLECYKKVSKEDVESDNINVDEIVREASTNDNKRIDLLIETDKYLIVIENKIYASPYNPFDSYHKFAEKYVKSNNLDLKIVEILLSIKKENNQLSSKYRFYNITYDLLLDKVKKNLGDYLLNSNEKWLVYMKDFMTYIEYLKGGSTVNVDKEWNQFLENNNNAISSFFDNYFNDLNKKMKLIDNLTSELKNLDKTNLRIGAYNTTYNRISNRNSKESSYASNYVDIKYDNTVFAIESYIMKRPTSKSYEQSNYLYVALWNRHDKNYDFEYLIDTIKKNTNLVPERIETSGWGVHYILKKYNLTEDIELSEIAELILKIAYLIK